MKRWQWIVGTIAALLVVSGAYLYVQVRSLEVERLSDDLYVLRGLGGNTAVLRTDAGAVVVDTMTVSLQGARIRELGDRCATLERELRDAAVASVRAQAKERELEATRERLEAKLSAANDALSSERERFDAERTQRPLAPAPTPGLVLFDADADVAIDPNRLGNLYRPGIY